MKKFLFLGACVASLAVASSSAFAAVSYGQGGTLTVTAPADGSTDPVTSITVDASSFGTDGQKTLLMTKDGDSTGFIYYIDQAQSGTGIFEGLVLNLPEGKEALDAGTYTIKVGNDKATAIQTATLTIADNQTPAVGKDIVWGDVNGDDAIKVDDATAILNLMAGGPANKEETKAKFNYYSKLTDGTTQFVYGDVNGDDAIKVDDATAILNLMAGGSASKADTGSKFDYYVTVSNVVEVVE